MAICSYMARRVCVRFLSLQRTCELANASRIAISFRPFWNSFLPAVLSPDYFFASSAACVRARVSTFFHFYYIFTTYCFSVTLRRSFYFDCQTDGWPWSESIYRYASRKTFAYLLLDVIVCLRRRVRYLSLEVRATYACTKDFCFGLIRQQLNENRRGRRRRKNSYIVVAVAALTLQTHTLNLNMSILCACL